MKISSKKVNFLSYLFEVVNRLKYQRFQGRLHRCWAHGKKSFKKHYFLILLCGCAGCVPLTTLGDSVMQSIQGQSKEAQKSTRPQDLTCRTSGNYSAEDNCCILSPLETGLPAGVINQRMIKEYGFETDRRKIISKPGRYYEADANPSISRYVLANDVQSRSQPHVAMWMGAQIAGENNSTVSILYCERREGRFKPSSSLKFHHDVQQSILATLKK